MSTEKKKTSFTLAQERFTFARQEIERRMRAIQPEPIKKYGVKIGGKTFPVKQVLSIVTSLSRADFNSHQAHQILKRMGFEIIPK